tara:strand:- start:32 stop:190 length:159 start_codon:yes stop_codon:yes gene_type:complete
LSELLQKALKFRASEKAIVILVEGVQPLVDHLEDLFLANHARTDRCSREDRI